MICAETAINKIRRDLTVGAAVRWSLAALIVAGMLGGPLMDEAGALAMVLLLGAGGAWVALSLRSVRGSQMAAESSTLIAAGQYEQAERQIAQALESFSIFRTTKLMSLHHLAMLRHAQSRWQESAMLCRALLKHKPAALSGMDRASRLMLAESLLELGDLRGAYENLLALYDQRLPLSEALNLLGVQLSYLGRIGAWQAMLIGLPARVPLIELMPPQASARSHALLALAAKKTGRMELYEWLRRRTELLADVRKLCDDLPILGEAMIVD